MPGRCALILCERLHFYGRRRLIFYTIIKTANVGDGRLSMVCAAGRPVTLTGWTAGRRRWAWSKCEWSTRNEEHTLSGTGARLHCTQGLAARGDGYQCGLDWERSSIDVRLSHQQQILHYTSGYATMVHGRGCNPHRSMTTFAKPEMTHL